MRHVPYLFPICNREKPILSRFARRSRQIALRDACFGEAEKCLASRRSGMLQDMLHAAMVPRRGLEPPRPCERQHLKLVRLPIPPPGHFVSFSAGGGL